MAAFMTSVVFFPELKQEAQQRGINVQGYRNLEPLLQELLAATPELELATAEVAERIQEPDELEAADFVRPSPLLPREARTRPAVHQLESALARAQAAFQGIDG